MDPFLAEYYGTDQGAGYDEDALEKMAQLTLLTKEAEEEGIDLSGLSEEELLALSDEVYGGEEDPMEKEASDMFETFDFGGRVMAHSMWNELENIQKEAAKGGGAWEATKRGLRRAHRATLGRVGAAAERSYTGRAVPKKLSLAGKGMSPSQEKAMLKQVRKQHPKATLDTIRGGGLTAGEREAAQQGIMEGIGRTGRRLNIAAQVGTGLGTAGAAGAAGYGGYRALKGRKEKRSSDSAFEQLVEQRAMEHLYASGYMDNQGNIYEPEVEKTAGDFDDVVNDAALQYLSELGYPVE